MNRHSMRRFLASFAAAALGVSVALSLALPAAAQDAPPAANHPPPGRGANGPHGRPMFRRGAPGTHAPGTHAPGAPTASGGAAAHEGAPGAAHDVESAHGASEDAHGGNAEHGGEHHVAPFNFADFSSKTPPYLALLINFALLFGAYFYFGRKPVAVALKERRANVAKEIEEAARILKEAEGRAKTYQKKLDNLGAEQETARKALEEAGKGERDRILKEAEERAVRMKRDAEFLVEQEVKQLRQDLVREAVELASVQAEKILAEKVTNEDHERLANEFLAALASAKPAQAGQVGGPS